MSLLSGVSAANMRPCLPPYTVAVCEELGREINAWPLTKATYLHSGQHLFRQHARQLDTPPNVCAQLPTLQNRLFLVVGSDAGDVERSATRRSDLRRCNRRAEEQLLGCENEEWKGGKHDDQSRRDSLSKREVCCYVRYEKSFAR